MEYTYPSDPGPSILYFSFTQAMPLEGAGSLTRKPPMVMLTLQLDSAPGAGDKEPPASVGLTPSQQEPAVAVAPLITFLVGEAVAVG